jgi:hypothetical protein
MSRRSARFGGEIVLAAAAVGPFLDVTTAAPLDRVGAFVVHPGWRVDGSLDGWADEGPPP